MSNTADHQHEGRSASLPAFEGTPANALPLTASEDRQFATLAHFGGILGFIPSLLIFLIFKDRGPFTAQESKEALNFGIFMTILAVGIMVLGFILGIVTFGIGAILSAFYWIPGLLQVIFSIIGAMRVNNGGSYRYPFNWRMIS